MRSGLVNALLLAALGASWSCGPPTSSPGSAPAVEVNVPTPDTTAMEPQVEARLSETRAAVLANPRSPAAWGRFGMVAHAHELWDEAKGAYQEARELNEDDARWHYFLADVESVLGTDLEAAAAGFRRVEQLRPGYAPTHLRLGNVLVALSRPDEAAIEFEKALALAPDLQPARVALAQARLAGGEFESAERLLDEVLAEAPRHGQALATLAQVYQRLGKRTEAREVAERSRDAASYNLYQDPLMSEVVAAGVSSVALWERAKSFLENGNWEQASRGLQRVIGLQPDNADAHRQLALAYRNLGQLERSRHHLQRTIALAPEAAEPRVELATVELDLGNPPAATIALEQALALAPDHPAARWLMAKSLLDSGQPAEAVAAFQSASATGAVAPTWARAAWGSALAQNEQPVAALDQFRIALEAEPRNPEVLFYAGLVQEGLGDPDQAVTYYCRSLAAKANPPAASRLQALGRRCDG